MMQPRAWLSGVSGLALSLCFATSALAQDAANASDEPADENTIYVTAQFREQTVQDTPLAITAVSGETLEARGQVNLVDVGSFAPNVNLSQAAAIQGNAVSAFIRGIGQEDSNFALEPGVGIYIDDIYFGTTFGASLDLVDLQRVEVLRGPQGTLAGKNSLGGAIRLYSQRPTNEFEGFGEVGYGRFDNLNVRGSLNVPLAEGLATRFSASYRRDDGYFENRDYGCENPGQGIAPTGRADDDCVVSRAGGRDVLTLRGAVRIAPTDSPLEVNISGDYTRDKSQLPATAVRFANNPAVRSYVPGNPFAGVGFDSRFVTPDGAYYNYEDFSEAGNYTTVFCADPTNALTCFPYQVAPGVFPDAPRNDVDGWGIAATIELELSENLSLTSITGYRYADGTTVLAIDGSPLNILKERLHNRHEQFTQEVRLSGQVGSLVDFTVGGFYYDANDLLDFRIQIPTLLYDFETEDTVDNRSLAAFAHLELHLTDRLNVIGGLRYTDDRKTYNFVRLNADNSPIPLPTSPFDLYPNVLVATLDGLSGTYSGDRIDYRLGINYDFSDDFMAYAQVATGYKGGGVNPRPFVADQVTPFDPESLVTYEAGIKSTLADGIVTLNAAAFYNDYSDIQRTVYQCLDSASTACGKPVNAGDGHSMGAELEVAVNPGGGLGLMGSLALLDFEYDNINPATLITLDMAAPFHSKVTASAGAQYEADLNGSGFVTPRLDVSYQSSFFYQAVNNPIYNKIPGRALVNFGLTYETDDRNWQVRGAVTNIFDHYYDVATSENIGNFGLSTSIVGRPREWSVSVRRRF